MNRSTTIEHFTHPGHALVELKADTEYLCDGCKTLGTGTRFRCNTCDFDLHEYCGNCPKSLSCFMHPHNQLTLVMRKSQGMRTKIRTCDVCGESIEGLFYWCKDCEFDVHPICSQFPEKLRHALHPAHPLTFQASKTVGYCGVCRGVCNSWRYRCGDCDGFDIHPECVLVSCHTDTTSRHGPIPPPYPPQGPPPPPNYGTGYACGGVPYGWNPYYNYQAPAHNMYNAYGGVAYGSNPYNMACASNYQVPAYSVHNYPNQAQQAQGGGKKMFKLVSKLALEVLSNVMFGTGGFSDLMGGLN